MPGTSPKIARNIARKFDGEQLVVASHNAGKVDEFTALLAPFNMEVVPASALGLAEPEESGTSFIENAELKARAACLAADLPSLADDSGLAVSALDGAPGIYSARWAGPTKDFGAAMQRVERDIAGRGDRGAQFICAISLCWPDGHCETFEGRVDGTLVWPPRGNHGFGYDPVFLPTGGTETFGEMDPDAKHAISHRADAFRQLIGACFSA